MNEVLPQEVPFLVKNASQRKEPHVERNRMNAENPEGSHSQVQ